MPTTPKTPAKTTGPEKVPTLDGGTAEPPSRKAAAPDIHFAYFVESVTGMNLDATPFGSRKQDREAAMEYALSHDGWNVITVHPGQTLTEALKSAGRL